MAFNNKFKPKSRLPMPNAKKVDVLFDSDERSVRSNSARSDRSDVSSTTEETGAENRRNPVRKQNKSKLPAQHLQPAKSKAGPLAKAMQRRPQNQQSQERQSETYAEEKVESVSQKLRGKSQADHRKRREEMEVQLQEAEEQLIEMRGLLDKREQMLRENEEDSETKQAELENRLASQDEKLISHGIDPVTGEKVLLSEGEEKKVEKTRKFTKKYIEEMRQKLQQMNAQTVTLIENIETTVNYLDSLEDASDRAGPISKDVQKIVDDTGADSFIAKMYKENVKSNSQEESEGESSEQEEERLGPSGRGTPEDEEQEVDQEEVCEQEDKQEEVVGSKVFLTARGVSGVTESDLFSEVESESVSVEDT